MALGSSGTAWNGGVTRGAVVVGAGDGIVVAGAVTDVVCDPVADACRDATIDVGGTGRGSERSPGLRPADTSPAASTTAMLAAHPHRAIGGAFQGVGQGAHAGGGWAVSRAEIPTTATMPATSITIHVATGVRVARVVATVARPTPAGPAAGERGRQLLPHDRPAALGDDEHGGDDGGLQGQRPPVGGRHQVGRRTDDLERHGQARADQRHHGPAGHGGEPGQQVVEGQGPLLRGATTATSRNRPPSHTLTETRWTRRANSPSGAGGRAVAHRAEGVQHGEPDGRAGHPPRPRRGHPGAAGEQSPDQGAGHAEQEEPGGGDPPEPEVQEVADPRRPDGVGDGHPVGHRQLEHGQERGRRGRHRDRDPDERAGPPVGGARRPHHHQEDDPAHRRRHPEVEGHAGHDQGRAQPGVEVRLGQRTGPGRPRHRRTRRRWRPASPKSNR